MNRGHDNPDPVELVKVAVARYTYEGNRARLVRERWGLNLNQFWQLVNGCIDDPDVYRAAPRETRVLQERRDAMQRQRRSA